jgi:hypothetical protein
MKLMLGNRGTAPANDIDIFLYFPDGFELYDKESLPPIPSEPEPPEKPGVSRLGSMVAQLQPAMWNFQMPKVGPTNVSAPLIRKTESYEVRIHVGQQKHNLEQPVASLYAIFESYEAARSFGFHYTLVAANLPKPIEGDLHVIVKKNVPSSNEEAMDTQRKE